MSSLSASPTTLESSLSSAELVPFQGYVIPPLTPQHNLSPEDSLVNSSAETGNPPAQDGDSWKGIAECHGKALGHSIAVNKQVRSYGALLHNVNDVNGDTKFDVIWTIMDLNCEIIIVKNYNYINYLVI